MAYAGIGDLQEQPHKKLLQKVTPHQATMLMRIWGGSILTKAHWPAVDANIEPECGCGHHAQTFDHLLYFCSLVNPAAPHFPFSRLGFETTCKICRAVVPPPPC